MKKFLYFAYGSNLLKKRIHINNPSAIRKGYGQLKDFRLDFITYSKRWQGASATIVPTPGASVWGAVWEMDMEDLAHLDRQEGVHDNMYFPLNVKIFLPSEETIECRVYQQTATPEELKEGETLPVERRPSEIYHQYIVEGAIETGLPQFYIDNLKSIPSVPFKGEIDLTINLKD